MKLDRRPDTTTSLLELHSTTDCVADTNPWVDIYRADESGLSLIRRVSLVERVELELPPDVYVVVGAESATPVIADLVRQSRVLERIPPNVGGGRDPRDGAPRPPEPAIEFIRGQTALESFVRANAPHLLLGAAFNRSQAQLGVVERDGRDQPRIETLGDARVIRGTLGAIVYTPLFGAHAILGPIYQAWQALQAKAVSRGLSYWAYPTSDERDAEGGGGRCQFFRRLDTASFQAALYWSAPSGAHEVQSAFLTAFGARGFSGGDLGFPVEAESSYDFGTPAARQVFQRGRLYQSYFPGQQGTFAVSGAMHLAWAQHGGEAVVGVPTSEQALDEGALVQHFRRPGGWTSTIVLRGEKSYWLWGQIRERWMTDRRAAYGWPLSSAEPNTPQVTTQFENYYVQWNGLQAQDPQFRYVETPVRVPAGKSGPLLHQLNLVPPQEGVSGGYYAATVLGSYVDLKAIQMFDRLLVATDTMFREGKFAQAVVLKPGESLGPARFDKLFGSGPAVRIAAVPVDPSGTRLFPAESIGVGLTPKP